MLQHSLFLWRFDYLVYIQQRPRTPSVYPAKATHIAMLLVKLLQVSKLVSIINSLEANGGGDEAEDIAGMLKASARHICPDA